MSDPDGVKYHWVLTIQSSVPGITQVAYTSGVYTADPGQTRSDIFRELYQSAAEQNRTPSFSNFVPLFFSLEPEELPAPAALNGAQR